MPRPPKGRRVEYIPEIKYFKPAAVPMRELEEVVLTIEEVEAIRLKDRSGLMQEECAEKMKVSRATFQRILQEARSKIADALICGKAIRFQGGDYYLGLRKLHCQHCDEIFEKAIKGNSTDKDVADCPECGTPLDEFPSLEVERDK